jgi:RNA polymerase-binding transcription factor DksA
MEVPMTTLGERKAQLLARLGALQTRLEGIEEELDSHRNPDWDDLAAEREGDEVLEGLGLSGQREIRRISAALARIEAGKYGACTRCGAEITAARLDAMPEAPLCQNCAGAGQG